VATRDGSPILANVFRPAGDGRSPVIVCMSPYGKDTAVLGVPRQYGLEAATGPHAIWETPDAGWWVPQGYAMVRADSRGAFKSPGKRDFLSRKEQEDYYDLIEWAAAQPWCTGKVGLLGVSFYAMAQWLVAALQPPHLAAIVPWEGLTDLYREWAYQGGIYGNFTKRWWNSHYTSQGQDKGSFIDWRTEFKRRPLDDDWYSVRSPAVELITVPLMSVGNWGAFHLHLRGNVEGYLRASSKNKRLLMCVGSHIAPFYSEWGKAEQLRFLDRWLKEIPNGAENDAPVRLAIRHGAEIRWRDEREWPLARTHWTKLFLDAGIGSLAWKSPRAMATTRYTAPAGMARFETAPVEGKDLEITGPVALRVWVSSASEDMDLFIALHDIGPDGKEVFGIGPRGGPIQMSMGWLRASHRELDPERSLPHRPYHTHKRRLPLVAGEPTAVDVEIWPTCVVLAPGHRLRLEISGNDDHMKADHYQHDDADDRPAKLFDGEKTIHTGGAHESYLLLPVIPT
jgi:uncharacterized protein